MRDDIKVALAAVALLLLIVLSTYASWANASSSTIPEPTPAPTPQVSAQAQVCLNCHTSANADLVHNWEDSKHIVFGVDCLSCHDASNKGDRPDIIEHYGARIITRVNVGDCEECHRREIPGSEK